MNHRISLALAGITAALTLAGHASATPPFGTVFNNVLATGTTNKDVRTIARVPLPGDGDHDRDDEWSAIAAADGPANFVTQDVEFIPGGYTGWHNHPGILFLTLTEGSVEWYDAQCRKTVYNAGDSWTENTPLHYVRAVGSVNARFMITYFIAKDQPKRIDQPPVACAAAHGLN